MATEIEWTDETWNPVVGCTMVSPGCAHCYAETMAKRLKAMALKDISDGKDPGRKRHYIDAIGENGRWSGNLIPVPEALADPLGWKKPRRVFVNSMSDLFHESVPFEFVDRVFAVMNATAFTLPIKLSSKRWHTHQVLTKRPERMAEYMLSRSTRNFRQGEHLLLYAGRGEGGVLRGHGLEAMNAGAVIQWPPPNVWLGTSVEDQKRADERIPHLLRCPAAIRFLSCEPLLGPVDLSPWLAIEADRDGTWRRKSKFAEEPHLDWVIVGGESGHGARPCDIAWIRSIVAQCKAAGVACFVKQLGAVAIQEIAPRCDALLNLRDKKGGDWDEWPSDLRVREFPRCAN